MLTIERLTALKESLIAKIEDRLRPDQKSHLLATKILLNPRMRTTAGRAHQRKNLIEMNVVLLSRNPATIESTFAHELAHIIAGVIYGPRGRGHGSPWKSVMRTLGYAPERTHDLDCSDLKRTHSVVAYAKCLCGPIPLKSQRANKMLNGTTYRCRRCDSRIELQNSDNVLLDQLHRGLGGRRG
jgi:predicted SprT family Zn-dependent metalloprotease